MRTTIEKQPKSTIKLNVTVDATKVKASYEKLLEQVVKTAEIPGFRKGNAPKEKVLEKTDVSKLYGEVVNDLLQTYYPQALKEHHIAPVSNPKVEIKEFDLEKDFEFVATVAVKPEVKLGGYKAELKKSYEQRSKKLRESNAEKLKKGENLDSEHVHLIPNDVIDALVSTSTIEIADILKEDEADRMMSRLVDQAQTIGLSLEHYLKSQNKTAEQLREDYLKTAEKSLIAEFALNKLAEEQKIEITDAEVEQMIAATGDSATQEQMQDPTQRWYIKSILIKNKLISSIIEEIQGEHNHV